MKAKSLDEQLAEAKELVAQRIKKAEDKQIYEKSIIILETQNMKNIFSHPLKSLYKFFSINGYCFGVGYFLGNHRIFYGDGIKIEKRDVVSTTIVSITAYKEPVFEMWKRDHWCWSCANGQSSHTTVWYDLKRYIPGFEENLDSQYKIAQAIQTGTYQKQKELEKELTTLKTNFALEEPSNIRNRFGP